MIRLSACVEMIFRELPFIERLARVAAAGLPAFEFWRPAGKDLDTIHRAKNDLGLQVATFSGAGETLLDLAAHDAYCATFAAAAEWAQRLDCPTLIVTTGNTLPDVPRSAQRDALRAGLERVARVAESAGVTAVLEPLNTKVDHPGYFLDHSAEAFALATEVGSPQLKVLFDIYHMQIMEGGVTTTLLDHLDQIGHVHVADVPGRHEPGTGELNYRTILHALDAAGYTGYVGLEYRPQADAAQSLTQVQQLLFAELT